MSNTRRTTLLFYGVFAGAVLFLFSPGIFLSQIPAFRDAYHFYYPQAVWLDACVQEGEWFPQWNPLDGLGSSIPGQVSTGIYYPLRIVYALPLLSIEQRLSLFLALHVLLAALCMHLAARRLGAPQAGCRLAAVSFALSCPVFFQHNNLIYLCSASWISFFLASWLSWCKVNVPNKEVTIRDGIACTFRLAASLSMMLLSGDPHTAFNACIVAFLATLLHCWKQRSWELAPRSLGILAAAVTLTLAVTCVQWLPAWRWSTLSNRANAAPALPDPSQISVDQRIALESTLTFELSEQLIYDFSLPPWHLASCVWPTFAGHYAPGHSRWVDALAAEGRMWVPALYFGLVPCLIVLGSLFRKKAKERWLLGLAVFALLASLGNYSIVWLLREVLSGLGLANAADSLPRDESLSIYGMLTFLPGYGGFRFPAKWTVWFGAAVSLFAASNLDLYASQDERSDTPQSWFGLRGIIAISSWLLVALGAAVWLTPLGESLAQRVRVDAWLGSADAGAIANAFLLAGLLPLFTLRILGQLEATHKSGTWIAGLTMLEMSCVACFWTSFAPAPDLEKHLVGTTHDSRLWSNVLQADLTDQTDANLSNLSRQTQLQNQYMLGKLASAGDRANLASQQSVEPLWSEKLRIWLASHDRLEAEQPILDAMLARLGVSHRLVLDRANRSFAWQPVESPAPVCQLWKADGTEAMDTPVEWQWQGSELKMHFEATEASRLVIRQFSDGGWTVRCPQWNQSTVIESPALFIEIPVPAGEADVILQRKWLW
ncbi:MAG: hypothetical protein AAF394_08650 [Planctomycetota bacterium]